MTRRPDSVQNPKLEKCFSCGPAVHPWADPNNYARGCRLLFLSSAYFKEGRMDHPREQLDPLTTLEKQLDPLGPIAS